MNQLIIQLNTKHYIVLTFAIHHYLALMLILKLNYVIQIICLFMELPAKMFNLIPILFLQ